MHDVHNKLFDYPNNIIIYYCIHTYIIYMYKQKHTYTHKSKQQECCKDFSEEITLQKDILITEFNGF